MASNIERKKRSGKRNQIEIIPENAPFEDHIPSFEDESLSDDTRGGEEISDASRKRKKNNSSSNISTSLEVEDKSSKQTELEVNHYEKKKIKKRSEAWNYFEEIEENGEKFAKCTLCQQRLKLNKTSSTTTLNRHVHKCLAKHGLTKQTQLQFQASGNSEVTVATFKYDHAEMRLKLCGADWAREIYGLKKANQKDTKKDIEIDLA